MSSPNIQRSPSPLPLIAAGEDRSGVFAEGSDVLNTFGTLGQTLGKVKIVLQTASGEDRDLELAKAVGARDYRSDRDGGTGTVRNVVPVSDLHDECGLSMTKLAALIKGRDYIVLTHGRGLNARTSVIVNDSVNKNVPTALALIQNGKAEVLMEGALHALCEHAQDRVVLGPLAHQAAVKSGRAGLYHESQRGEECAMHAINALHGGPVLNKATLDQFLMRQHLQTHPGTITQNDFYRNAPPEDPLGEALVNFDFGLPPNECAALMKEFLKGEVVAHANRSAPASAEHSARSIHDSIVDFARVQQETAKGFVLYVPADQTASPHTSKTTGHYVAFVKADSAQSGEVAWYLLDSTRGDQPRLTLPDFLDQQPEDVRASCWAMSWHPPQQPA